jgi:TonB family protein
MIRYSALLLASLILTTSLASSTDKKQEEGKALMNRAKQLSDIRADGAPAFTFRASIKVIGTDSVTSEGTYTETWVSREKWRSETVLGSFRRVLVVNGNKRCISKNSSPTPEGLSEVGFSMDAPYFTPGWWKIGKIEDKETNSMSMRCLESEPYPLGGGTSVCFDKTSGLVAARRYAGLPDPQLDRTCTYSDYQKFGDKLFPWVIRCAEKQRIVFETSVAEPKAEPSSDPALFAPLADAKESVNCHGMPNPPVAIYQPSPEPPRRENPPHPVVLSISVGVDGIPSDPKVVQSIDSAFDSAAVQAVKGWRFKLATCDGQPIVTAIRVEIVFRSFLRTRLARISAAFPIRNSICS